MLMLLEGLHISFALILPVVHVVLKMRARIPNYFLFFKALHFNTFGGNPMACAVGLSVLETIEEEGCQHNSKEVGTHLLNKLVKLVDK